MSENIETVSIEVVENGVWEPVRAYRLRGQDYNSELTAERLILSKRRWWENEILLRRFAWTIGVTAAVLFIFTLGFLAGAQ